MDTLAVAREWADKVSKQRSCGDSGDEDTPDAAGVDHAADSLEEVSRKQGRKRAAAPTKRPSKVSAMSSSSAPPKMEGCSSTKMRAQSAISQMQRQLEEGIPVHHKKKTGYQLFHMYRVAELKETTVGGIKHHDAFKRAARDWTALSQADQDFYNELAETELCPPHSNARFGGAPMVTGSSYVPDLRQDFEQEDEEEGDAGVAAAFGGSTRKRAHVAPAMELPDSVGDKVPLPLPHPQHHASFWGASAEEEHRVISEPPSPNELISWNPLGAFVHDPANSMPHPNSLEPLLQPFDGRGEGISADLDLCAFCSGGDKMCVFCLHGEK